MHLRLRHLRATTIVCLIVVICLAAMWTRSRYVADSAGYNWHRNDQSNEWRFAARSERGQLMLAFFNWTPDYYLSPFSKVSSKHGAWLDTWRLDRPSGEFWSDWSINEAWSGNREIGLIIPFWLPTIPLLALLITRLVRRIRSKALSLEAGFPVSTGEVAGA